MKLMKFQIFMIFMKLDDFYDFYGRAGREDPRELLKMTRRRPKLPTTAANRAANRAFPCH